MKPEPSIKGAPRKKSKPARPATAAITPSPKATRARPAVPAPVERPKPLTAWTNTQLWLLAFLGTLIAMVAVGLVFGPASAVLVLTAFAFISVIALFWTSLRTLLGETPIESADAFAIGAPRVEEEQKRAVLRALKDLEFERGVGKISEDDYKVLVAQYRDEAKRLLRQLDERGAAHRARAEMIVAERFVVKGPASKEKIAEPIDDDEDQDDEEDEAPESGSEAPSATSEKADVEKDEKKAEALDQDSARKPGEPADDEDDESEDEDEDADSENPRGKADRNAP
jgi:hypothetical protein